MNSLLIEYIKLSFRNRRKHLRLSIIGIIGLLLVGVLGLYTYSWISQEVAINRQIGQNVLRIMTNLQSQNGVLETNPNTPYPLADALKTNLGHKVTAAAQMSEEPQTKFVYDNEVSELDIVGIGGDFFQVFPYEFSAGSSDQLFDRANTILISKEKADMLFDDVNPVGQVLKMMDGGDLIPYEVIGVFEPKVKLSFGADVFMDIEYFVEWNSDDWQSYWLKTVIKVADNQEIAGLDRDIEYMADEHKEGEGFDFFLQEFRKSYLHNSFADGKVQGGIITNIRYLVLAFVIAAIISLINFININLAQYNKRMKELSVRNVFGSTSSDFLRLILSDFLVLTLLLTICTIGVAFVIHPYMQDYFLTEFQLGGVSQWLMVLSFYAIISFFASLVIYFRVAHNKISVVPGMVKNPFLSQPSMYLQIGTALILFIFAFGVLLQGEYLRNKRLGINTSNVLEVPVNRPTWINSKAIKGELLNRSFIEEVTYASTPLTESSGKTAGVKVEGLDISSRWIDFITVSADFLEVFEIETLDVDEKTLQFLKDRDTVFFMVNEEFANVMSKGSLISKKMHMWGKTGPILGITESFHFSSLHEEVAPLILRFVPYGSALQFVRYKAGYEEEAIATLEDLHNQYAEGLPFKYTVLENRFIDLYASEFTLSRLLTIFSVLNILIACLGLYAVVLVSCQARVQEIAVRKVLGAANQDILLFLTRSYMIIFSVSAVVSVVAGKWLIDRWLENFAFQANITFIHYVIPIAVFLLVILLIIGGIMRNVFKRRPVEAINYE